MLAECARFLLQRGQHRAPSLPSEPSAHAKLTESCCDVSGKERAINILASVLVEGAADAVTLAGLATGVVMDGAIPELAVGVGVTCVP